jgi:hypothetical protein
MQKVVIKIALGAGTLVLLAGSLLTMRRDSATASPRPSVAVSPAQDVPYTPSRFPGVRVRHVPANTAAKSGAAWVGKRPGTVTPRGGFQLPSVATRAPGATVRTGRGTTRFGGKWVEVPRHKMPMSVGQRAKTGKVVTHCVEHSTSQPHTH